MVRACEGGGHRGQPFTVFVRMGCLYPPRSHSSCPSQLQPASLRCRGRPAEQSAGDPGPTLATALAGTQTVHV